MNSKQKLMQLETRLQEVPTRRLMEPEMFNPGAFFLQELQARQLPCNKVNLRSHRIPLQTLSDEDRCPVIIPIVPAPKNSLRHRPATRKPLIQRHLI